MKNKLIIALILIISIFTNFNLIAQKQLFTQYNLNFEIGNVGENAPGWSMTNVVKKFGYETKLTSLNKSEGQKSLNIYHNGKKYFEDMYGSVFQGLDAVPFRNRKVTFSADVYFENSDDTTKVFLWIHEHFIDGSKGQFVISEMDSSKDSKWKRMSVDLEADPFVDYINYGFYLNGKGNLFVDNAKLELISPFKTPNMNEIDLAQNDFEKLYNFANIFSKIGFFHPKQSMYEADKFSMIHKGVNLALGLEKSNLEKSSDLIGNKLSFVEMMNEFFGKMDKNITIYNPKLSPKPNIDLNNGVNLLTKVNGESYSLLNYGAYNNKKSPTARSERNNIFGTQRTKEGSLLQVIDLNKLKLKNKLTQVTIEAKSRLVKYSQGANAQIWARVDVENQKESMYTTMNDKPMTDSIWTGINITMNVPKDAKALRVGLVLVGDGEVYFDDVKITGIDATSKKVNIPIENANFQDGMAIEAPKNWEVAKAVIQAGYNFEILDDKVARSKVLKISSDKSTFIEMPKLNQFVNCNINDSLSVYLPINIEEEYKDVKFEYPFEMIETNDNDAISRIASIIYLTSIINEFTNAKIDYRTFYDAITKAGNTNSGKQSFEKILSELLAKIKDSGARVWNPEITQKYSYPFTLKYNNGNVYISQIADSNTVKFNLENGNKIDNYESLLNKLKVGYKLNSINGENIKNIIDREKKYIPNNNEEFLYTRLLADLRSSDSVEIDNLEFSDFEGNSILIQVPKAFPINKINQERPEPLFELSKGIVYCDMTRTSDEMFKYYLNDFKELKAMIFDLRGLSIMSEYFLGFFTDKEIPSYTMELPIYTTPKDADINISNRIKYVQSIKSLKDQLGAKLYFITDEYTIGYSELIAQTVKDNKLGTLIGSKTAGGNSEIATLRLPCNYLLSLPTLNVYNGKNINITSKPVEPDVLIKHDFKNNIEYNRNNSEISQDYYINYTNNYIIETLKLK